MPILAFYNKRHKRCRVCSLPNGSLSALHEHHITGALQLRSKHQAEKGTKLSNLLTTISTIPKNSAISFAIAFTFSSSLLTCTCCTFLTNFSQIFHYFLPLSPYFNIIYTFIFCQVPYSCSFYQALLASWTLPTPTFFHN